MSSRAPDTVHLCSGLNCTMEDTIQPIEVRLNNQSLLMDNIIHLPHKWCHVHGCRNGHYYAVHRSIWYRTMGDFSAALICIPHLEQIMQRKLTLQDLAPTPINKVIFEMGMDAYREDGIDNLHPRRWF